MQNVKLITIALSLLAFILPLFFLPLTADFYFFNKTLLLHCSIGLLLVFWAVKIVREGRVRITRSPLDLPILLLAICYFLSIIFVSPNKIEALLGRGGLIISLTILYFIIINNLYAIGYALSAMILSASLLSLLAIYQYIGVGTGLFELPVWMQPRIWTPAGSPLALLSFLLPVFVLSLISAIKNKDSLIKTLLFLAAALQITGIILTSSLILPGKEFAINLLPHRAGWQIAASAFGSSPLFGVGPENFLSAFTRFRLIYLNNLESWTMRFFASSNEYFQIFTTTGILGFLAFLLLIIRLLKTTIPHTPYPIPYTLFTIFLLQVFLPANLLLLFLMYFLLGVFVVSLKNAGSEGVHETSIQLPILRKSPWFLLIPVLILISSLYYLTSKAWLADYYFRQSLLAAAENKGKETYDLQIKAIQLNPYVDRYRIAYSQTNLALANSIAGKADISDQDRQDIAQLVQQAIREAKAATALNRSKVTNWENLANLYRNLINFAQEAGQWAIASYIQAIRLDPTNPLLRVDLGGLYYSLTNYDDAIRQFEIATELKPDYVNGYYNLAAAYREKDEIQKAVDNMEVVTNLVDIDSADYQTAKSELEELREKLPEEEKLEEVGEPETLKEPESLPTPMITPPIELPEEAQPEITPGLTPSPTPSPMITPTPIP